MAEAVIFAEEECAVLASDHRLAAVAIPRAFGACEDASQVAQFAGGGIIAEKVHAVLGSAIETVDFSASISQSGDVRLVGGFAQADDTFLLRGELEEESVDGATIVFSRLGTLCPGVHAIVEFASFDAGCLTGKLGYAVVIDAVEPSIETSGEDAR